MSTTQETRLNLPGQIALTGSASIVVNAVTHPLSTIKNRLYMGQRISSIFDIYRGVSAMCAVDGATFGSAYVANDILNPQFGSTWASIFSGLVSTPINAVGEGLATNRQVNGFTYAQAWRNSLRIHGLIATGLREIPFNWALFALSPKVDRSLRLYALKMQHQSRIRKALENDVFRKTFAGGLTTGIAGFATTPLDLIRARVQASPQPISIYAAFRSAFAKEGWWGLYRGSYARAGYVGAAGAIMNVLYDIIPPRLPNACKL